MINKKWLVLWAAAAFTLQGYAQTNANAVKFAKSINSANAKKHLSILASDEFEGRETGKKGAWMAAEYLKKQFKQLGLKGPVKNNKDPYFQPIGFYSQKIEEASLFIGDEQKEYLKDFYMMPNAVSGINFKVKATEVAFIGNGTKNELKGINLTGKMVVMFSSGLSTTGRFGLPKEKLDFLIAQKATGVLLISPMADRISPNFKNYLSNEIDYLKIETEKLIPIVNINSAIANQILAKANTNVTAVKKQIEDEKKSASMLITIPISFSVQVNEQKLRAENVLGFLEGSDPKLKKEVLVLTAHYDHIGMDNNPDATDKVFNGADDDGSGTTGVLLMAEAFMKAKKAGKGPKRSILFMTVVGEEKGLLGSEWYSEHPVFPLKNTIANLNTDMIGRIGEDYLNTPDSANYVYSVGSGKLSSTLAKVQDKANKTYTKLKLDFKYDDPNDPEQIYYRSDHYNFAKYNIPIIFFYDGMLGKDYHGVGDEVEKINFDLLTKRAHLIYYIAWDLANRATRPAVDRDGKGNPIN